MDSTQLSNHINQILSGGHFSLPSLLLDSYLNCIKIYHIII